MLLALHTPYLPERLARVERLGVSAIQLRLGPGFPIDTNDSSLAEARQAAEALGRRGLTVVSLGCYRNVLDPDRQLRQEDVARVMNTIRMAPIFGTDVVGVFAGRDMELSVEDNIPVFQEVWRPIADLAGEMGVRIAFENCSMFRGYPVRGINFSHSPHAYRLMFEALPDEHLGIEFDPSHCLKQLIDPIAFLRQFPGRTFHVHVKDHERLPDMQQQHGCFDVRASRDRLPGFGHIDFPAIFRELRHQGYEGALTIEAERDPIYNSEPKLEEALHESVRKMHRWME